jgi:hypothetical protein
VLVASRVNGTLNQPPDREAAGADNAGFALLKSLGNRTRARSLPG